MPRTEIASAGGDERRPGVAGPGSPRPAPPSPPPPPSTPNRGTPRQHVAAAAPSPPAVAQASLRPLSRSARSQSSALRLRQLLRSPLSLPPFSLRLPSPPPATSPTLSCFPPLFAFDLRPAGPPTTTHKAPTRPTTSSSVLSSSTARVKMQTAPAAPRSRGPPFLAYPSRAVHLLCSSSRQVHDTSSASSRPPRATPRSLAPTRLRASLSLYLRATTMQVTRGLDNDLCEHQYGERAGR
ncbi:uncharacterized protein A4U43_UnF3960 [Asparagus officinalis]|uniref:Uncharacterized protein n=1 Tax=Asparagus officinalis TaxID=4686 RepID=A0A1R3L704_ASPOF|nr:uncharacterized protein A4U43_UnF3960 [Asparagus officinalis]